MLQVLDLFSGTGSSTRPFADAGDNVIRVELHPETGKAEIYADVLTITPKTPLIADVDRFDFIWASPPCTAFSVASIGHHWTQTRLTNYVPRTEAARHNQLLVEHTRWLIEQLDPRFYVIENPRGLLRKLPALKGLNRDTVWYCRYGDERAKPTDLWNNLPWTWNPKTCRNNATDCHHDRAPRGSRTGTQGRAGNRDRSMVPYLLGQEIRDTIVGVSAHSGRFDFG